MEEGKLTTTLGAGRVKSNNLVADQVGTRLDTLGDGVGDVATSGHESGGTPGVRGTITAVFLDLEPNGAVRELLVTQTSRHMDRSILSLSQLTQCQA